MSGALTPWALPHQWNKLKVLMAQGWEEGVPAGTKLNLKIRRGQRSVVLAWRFIAAGMRRNRGTGGERRLSGLCHPVPAVPCQSQGT